MMSIKPGITKGAKSPLPTLFVTPSQSKKKRVYSEVLAEATKQQNLVMLEAEAKRG